LKNIISILIISYFLIFACGTKLPLPSQQVSVTTFGANDTTYSHLSPVWNAATLGYSFLSPTDITIGPDGYIFVSDSGNNRIVALDRSGNILRHGNLDKIQNIPHPNAVDVDSKLNVLVANNSDKIYVWNQYINLIGFDSVVVAYVFRDTVTQEEFELSGQEAAEAFNQENNLVLIQFVFSADAALLDSVQDVSVLYDDPGSQFYGVAAGPARSDIFYVTDIAKNRILQLQLYASGVVKLKNDIILPTFSATLSKTVAIHGSGAGTVDNPRGITTDDNGNIYFAQLGANFLVQKLSGKTFTSVFNLNQNPIMDLGRFGGPYDLAINGSNSIFVVDTDSNRVLKFDAQGREVDLGIKGLGIADFNRPKGIAVSEGVVYVADTGNNRIERFQLSISEEDIPDQKEP